MSRQKSSADRFRAARAVAQGMAEQDRDVAKQAVLERDQKITVPLNQIKGRQEDTRQLNDGHIAALAESIGVLGLLEPLVVDRRHRLLAGGHRLAAIKRLRDTNTEAYQIQFPDELIPVRVMPFDADNDPERALRCEIAENEHRRDYTPAEVRVLADRLLQAGYTYQNHRPRKGEKTLGSALAVVIGKHRRTVSRYLNEYLGEEGDRQKITMTDVIVINEIKALRKLQKEMQKWQALLSEDANTPKRAELAAKLPEILALIEGVLAEAEETEEQPQT